MVNLALRHSVEQDTEDYILGLRCRKEGRD